MILRHLKTSERDVVVAYSR